jgi:FtsP/CotA-like multicopper oxidase with cupredoxin domain
VNLRFRDGTVYQSFPTDLDGYVPFDEVFPFFHWLVAEVDFARFKATGATITVDGGGPVAPGSTLNPQPQTDINPNTGDNLSRTETGSVLTQAMQVFLGQTNVIEWGKKEYAPGENGGISGIVFYATTRAEDDPRYAVGEEWEPGIPRVQVNLYADGDIDNEPCGNFPSNEDIDWNGDGLLDLPDAVIDDVNGDASVTLADVDNYPLDWSPDPQDPFKVLIMGIEDVDHNGNGQFDPGDAIQITWTDSWDDSLPTGCPGDPADPFWDANGDGIGGDCYDGLRNFNQVRPGVFDGGYAFDSYFPGGIASGSAEVEGLPVGTYVVEASTPPGYDLVKEEDKNVDFGDTYTPSLLLLPPVCVGDPHPVPAELSLFPGIEAPYAGEDRSLCNRKQIILTDGFNAAADFFMFTEVPKAGRIVGIILNDLANEFDPNNPSFGEKFAPPFLPISIRDYTGREIAKVYSDEFGAYNALVPSTYTVNLPSPSGVSPNMLTVCLNDPLDPQYNLQYSQFCYTFQYMPGTTTYLDTPVLPIAAFAGPDQFPLDCELPDGTPAISRVDGPGNSGPYVAATGETITIQSVGTAVSVPNPNFGAAGEPPTISRDYGFGANGTVTIGGVEQTVTSWSSTSIDVTVANAGQLVITRNDTQESSVVGITVTVGGPAPIRVPADFSTIQAAIDAPTTTDGDLILVAPGVYEELVILYKDVRLQGYGAGSTTINAVKAPADKAQNWRDKVGSLQTMGAFDILPGQVAGDDLLETGLFRTEEGPGVIVLGNLTNFNNARIDGFRIIGADQGGGIFVNGYTANLQISNNRISGNQGFFGGGIRVGHPSLVDIDLEGETFHVDAQNDFVAIHNNQITHNGGLNGSGGGISICTGADNYDVSRNFICGNFSSGDGGGFGHLGLSNDGSITNNTIIFNQSFNQGLTVSGGGISISGKPAVGNVDVSPGTGSVTVNSNLIQGNLAGAGDGGGISLRFVNGVDVTEEAIPDYQVSLENNIIVNNVTGLAGGGISMQDGIIISIDSNTVANNDSTATASEAFSAGPTVSSPQPAGIVSRSHSVELSTALGAGGFSDPVAFDNNIIWHNRSFYWTVTDGLVPDIGAGQPPVFSDLAVLGAAGQMNPLNGVLTDTTGYDPSNTSDDPGFIDEYFNRSAGIIVPPEVTTGIETAIAFDEGGNFIDVRFGPLTLTGNYLTGGGIGAEGEIGVLEFPDAAAHDVTTNKTASGAGASGSCFISAASSASLPVSGMFGLILALGAVLGVSFLVNGRNRSQVAVLTGRAKLLFGIGMLIFAMLMVGTIVNRAGAEVVIQCPPDTDGIDTDGDGIVGNDNVCMHLAAGDGFINMADGKLQYIFSFNDITGVPEDMAMMRGMLAATFPAPTIALKEGQKLYLTLTNVGMMVRPDLFDPHTVHYHGFPNAAPVFDGVPDASISINMGSSLTYFYNNVEPGTFIYHCHVEATEHMQMGMLGQLYVTPKQDGTMYEDPDGSGRTYTKFAYNDGDGSTGYDVDYPIQITGFDPDFHDASLTVQPLPFALMEDRYPMLNGRGYPDTVNPDELFNTADVAGYDPRAPQDRGPSQRLSALITATRGEKILLRISSLSTTSFHTLSVLGIPMKVVGMGARILRGPDGKNLFYETSSVTLGGGEAMDVILDTLAVEPGTYFLFTTNMNKLSNDAEDYGGMMTEIVISPQP